MLLLLLLLMQRCQEIKHKRKEDKFCLGALWRTEEGAREAENIYKTLITRRSSGKLTNAFG